MIDTDKYERILKDDDGRNNVFALDLLAEVKRLRHELEIKKEALAKSQSSYKELRKQLKAMIE